MPYWDEDEAQARWLASPEAQEQMRAEARFALGCLLVILAIIAAVALL